MNSHSNSMSLFEKLWQQHVVIPETESHPAILYIDTHWVHEVTSPQGFDQLRQRDLTVRRPDKTYATLDHSIPTQKATSEKPLNFTDPAAKHQVDTLIRNCRDFGIDLHHWENESHGIVHVLGPEIGRTLPGMSIVCGDSHTSTHGAFGALAFGIGTTEVGHVLATQCLLQRKPKSMRIQYNGRLAPGVSAKDLILHTIRTLGVDGGTGYVIEYAGDTIASLDMEARMTLCNMSIEAGARAGMIGVDQVTIDYLKQHLPNTSKELPIEEWQQWKSDSHASFDKELHIDVSQLKPMVTYGTDPGMAVEVDGRIPDKTPVRTLNYMGTHIHQAMHEVSIDMVFIGSCTNGRLNDLRAAAHVLAGRQIRKGLRMLIVPGSTAVKRAAEAEGLDQIFIAAGAEWRTPGCSMCIAMNGDRVSQGKTIISTSNRNFEGRQGPGSRTVLASPATAAASAIHGYISDPRPFFENEKLSPTSPQQNRAEVA